VDALVLALASVIRPMSVAAVYAMLSAARPTRLLTTYLAAGFAFSAGIGIVLVILLGITAGPRAPEEVRAVIPFALGAVSLSYAAGLLSGSVQAPAPDRTKATPGPDSSSWLGRQLADLSPRRAALAGVLTTSQGSSTSPHGESVNEAVVREVAESPASPSRSPGFAGVYSDPSHVLVDPDGSVHQQLALCFHAVPTVPDEGGQPHPDGIETNAAAWCANVDIVDLRMHPAMRLRIDNALLCAGAALL